MIHSSKKGGAFLAFIGKPLQFKLKSYNTSPDSRLLAERLSEPFIAHHHLCQSYQKRGSCDRMTTCQPQPLVVKGEESVNKPRSTSYLFTWMHMRISDIECFTATVLAAISSAACEGSISIDSFHPWWWPHAVITVWGTSIWFETFKRTLDACKVN